MKGQYLAGAEGSPLERNIYANKSALVLAWLLEWGVDRGTFSIREVVREQGVSIGLVQRVFKQLTWGGLMERSGERTRRTFSINHPLRLLNSWVEHYAITKKCKMWAYKSKQLNRKKLLQLKGGVALALHAAAAAYGKKNTNLETLELYLLDPSLRSKLEQIGHLEPCEQGYDVLIIEPYYKSLLDVRLLPKIQELYVSSPLLTYLDLYHFPLRGAEQAEFLQRRVPALKRMMKNGP